MIKKLCEIAVQAGEEIMKFYAKRSVDQLKADNSPLTEADQKAHAFISEELNKLNTGIPILSEESNKSEIKNRKAWRQFWLVDPLDGTKEFIKKSGEFTVNIALVNANEAVIGVVFVPAKHICYYAVKGEGAFKLDLYERPNEPMMLKTRKAKVDQLSVVASKDHAGPAVKKMIDSLPANTKLVSMGSALKFCLIAEGQADLYLRDLPTMEWDTAAAQCIVEEAGGVLLMPDGNRLTYNKESLQNPVLLTLGDKEFNWQDYIN